MNRSEFTNHTCERDLQVENFCTREATLKDNATTQKVNRTYQQVVTLNYARSTRQWSGNLTIPTNGRLLNASVDGEPLVIPWIEECDSEGKVRDSCKSAVSESLTLFERTFPIDVISWPRSESMCSGGQNTHCTKYTYDGKGKIHQSFGVDKAVTAGQNFSVSKTSRTVSSGSQKPVQVTVTR